MTCAEFQKALPYIIETGGNAEEEQHLRECPVCSDLVEDLRYIAEQAKLLVPMEDPSPRVWDEIKTALEREGMIRPGRARGRLLKSKSSLPWLGALGAVVLVAFAVFLLQRGEHKEAAAAVAGRQAAVAGVPLHRASMEMAPTEEEDQQLLRQVTAMRPDSAASYETSLKQVNASIADSKKSVEQYPDDADARHSLMRAYQQKAMLYELATRSLQ